VADRGLAGLGALLAALALAGLAGCGSQPPGEARPPFATIGPWTGPAWQRIVPTLGTTLRLDSANPCARGAPGCMDAVVAEMTRRLRPLASRCDHLAPFALMYRDLSREVRASVRAHSYRSPAFVTHLDAVFAALYFHALDSWRAGDRSSVPRAWRMAFAAAADHRVTALGDMLLGMNAHISRDLPYALAAVGSRLPDGASAAPDVTAINADISRAQARVISDERRRFDPSVDRPRGFRGWIQPARVPALIAAWRGEAAENARRLLGAHSAAARTRIETWIDANAALRALLIWRETRSTSLQTRARDRYCANQPEEPR
jgi:hypothetical protein